MTSYQGKDGGHFHPFPPDGGAIYQRYQKGVSGQSLCWGALDKRDMPAEGMPDEQIAAWAVQRLQQVHDQPFFLAVGFVRPHVPYTAPKEFFDLHPMQDIAMPKIPSNEMDDIPLLGKAMAHGTIEGGDHWNVLRVGPNYWKEMVRDHQTDPDEHLNQAANPKYAPIKERFKKHLPKKNALPPSMRDGGLDSFGKKVERLRSAGIPEWLGKDPETPDVN